MLSRRLVPAWRRTIFPRRYVQTFYDSQSGLHVPVHNEDHVAVYVASSNASTASKWSASGVAGLSVTENGNSLLQAWAEELKNGGATGKDTEVCLNYTEELANVEDAYETLGENLVLRLNSLNKDEFLEGVKSLQKRSCKIAMNVSVDDDDPILNASHVATLLDATTTLESTEKPFFLDYLWVYASDDADETVELCEELNYLDVPGPILKSRMILDLATNDFDSQEEIATECMTMGINKLVVPEDRIQWVASLIQGQGKTCSVA